MHPTKVAGILLAAGLNSDARGMARDIGLDVYYSEYDLQDLPEADANITISNHSHGYLVGWELKLDHDTHDDVGFIDQEDGLHKAIFS